MAKSLTKTKNNVTMDFTNDCVEVNGVNHIISLFTQIPVTKHVQAPMVCGGNLKMLWGDGEWGEGDEYPFFMRCLKCGGEDYYNEETSEKGCTMRIFKDK